MGTHPTNLFLWPLRIYIFYSTGSNSRVKKKIKVKNSPLLEPKVCENMGVVLCLSPFLNRLWPSGGGGGAGGTKHHKPALYTFLCVSSINVLPAAAHRGVAG